jgi:glycosyltransferase involved in cell wall biosynthesis
MRVTFVLPFAGMSGGNRVLAIYAERLRRRGHKITVVSAPLARLRISTKLKSLARGMGWPKDPGPEPSYFDGLAMPHRVLEMVRPIVDDDVPDADVVLATFWRTGPSVMALSPSKGAKAILLQGYETSPGQWDPAIDEVWNLPLRKIVISDWLVKLARDRFGDSNVYLVPNSVDTAHFYAPVRGKQSTPTVGMLYVTSHLKGVDVSVAALERVKKAVSELRVLAFGADRVSPELPLPKWVEFHYRPSQDEITRLYSNCDAWLCGSRQEGFHLPPLEAMACRCPVVSTSIGGPLDIIEEGNNGFLVPVEDSAGLGEKLITVLTLREEEWKRMSDAAFATANRHTWDDSTDLLESALRNIADEAESRKSKPARMGS